MIRTRIAPSPTGPLHIGTARTALYNYLFAKKNGGEFILRLEDTDTERSRDIYEDDIKKGLHWLNIGWDKEYKQSERFDIYKKYAQQLLDEDKAYEEAGDKGDEKAIILKSPKKSIKFNDLIRGEVEFSAEALSNDIVLLKSDGTPAYNFAAAVDDADMKISHVIRGEDHISNTPKQIIIQETLGFTRPKYAHLPLILGPDRSKLSKRHGAVSINEYKKEGYLAEALVNFMALIGWNPGGEGEIFSMKELIKEFSLEKVHRGGAVFGQDKLDWINQQHQRQQSPEKRRNWAKKLTDNERILDYVAGDSTGSISIYQDIHERALRYFEELEYDPELLNYKNTPKSATEEGFLKTLEILKKLNEKDFEINKINKLEEAIMPLADERGRGEVLWPLRVALSGESVSASPFELLALLGKERSISRIEKAREIL